MRDLIAYTYDRALEIICNEGICLMGAEITCPARHLSRGMGQLRVISQHEDGENRLFLTLAHEVETGKEVAEDGLQDF
ncbi:MAG: hypothetical protein PHD91_06085 [bacterium]|nr:hypothetical protein [bacterium]MDD4153265.1 hypothetical protein [bacterium]